MERLIEYAKEHAGALIIGAMLAGVAVYQLAPVQYKYQPMIEDRRPAPHEYNGDSASPPIPRREPHVRPWFPGAPHDPQECVARGGVDMGSYCHAWH